MTNSCESYKQEVDGADNEDNNLSDLVARPTCITYEASSDRRDHLSDVNQQTQHKQYLEAVAHVSQFI